MRSEALLAFELLALLELEEAAAGIADAEDGAGATEELLAALTATLASATAL